MRTLPLVTLMFTFITSNIVAQKEQKPKIETLNNLFTKNNTLIKPGRQTQIIVLKNEQKTIINKASLELETQNTQHIDTLSLFKNPTKDYLNVKTKPNSTIRIYNLKNLLVKNYLNYFGESFLDIRDLQKGIYKLDIIDPNNITVSYKLQVN